MKTDALHFDRSQNIILTVLCFANEKLKKVAELG